MSAPDTDVKKQSKRHRGPLFGFVVVLLWAGVLFAGFMAWTAYKGGEPTAETPLPVEQTE